MTVFYDVFNGDADGICALHQLRLSEPRASVLITGVKRDIALVVPLGVAAGDMVRAVRMHKDPILEDIALFDVFQGKNITSGYKSVALSITYRSASKTLTEKNVEKSNIKIVSLLMETFGASLRDA